MASIKEFHFWNATISKITKKLHWLYITKTTFFYLLLMASSWLSIWVYKAWYQDGRKHYAGYRCLALLLLAKWIYIWGHSTEYKLLYESLSPIMEKFVLFWFSFQEHLNEIDGLIMSMCPRLPCFRNIKSMESAERSIFKLTIVRNT